MQKRPAYLDLFRAQLGVVGRGGQKRLRNAQVHVSGTGGLGSQILMNLAAVGIGHLTANDPQTLEADNFNRVATASASDIGKPKVKLLKGALKERPYLTFLGVMAGNEDSAVSPFYQTADAIVCCSNTIKSRIAAAAAAIRHSKPIIDAGVADGNHTLAGTVRIWAPGRGNDAACPACYLNPDATLPRREALFFPVLAGTAAIASYSVVQLLLGSTALTSNLILIDFVEPRIEPLDVQRRRGCSVCAGRS